MSTPTTSKPWGWRVPPGDTRPYELYHPSHVESLLARAEMADELAQALEKAKRGHYYCEDSWYSCPLATDGCADDRQPEGVCNCGADEKNASIDAILTRYRALRTSGDSDRELLGLAAELLAVAKCPACDGSGGIPVQVSEHRLVSRDMAMDAGDPSMEGATYSEEQWEQQQCQWCAERTESLTQLRALLAQGVERKDEP